jgi:hypothetical protein
MSIQTTLGEPQPKPPKTDKTERDVVFTANGSKRASEVVYRTGALVGMESLNTRPPDKIPVNFVDWPFSKLDDFPDLGELFDAHLGVVERERPRYAVAPDIDDRVSYRDAVGMATELSQYADTVIVVPKTVLPTDVPSEFRVGMPCQERYGPTPWRWTQYRPCEEVHLLGGSPVKHHEILKYSVPIESVDTSVPVTSAGWGDYWNGEKWVNSTRDSEFFYHCLRRSYSNMRYSLNRRRRVFDVRCRNRRLDYEEEFWKQPDADLWGPNDRPPSPAYELRNDY